MKSMRPNLMIHQFQTQHGLIKLFATAMLLAFGLNTPEARAERSFQEVVQEHFRQWDTNYDGKLESAEIDQLMNHPGIHGEAAAALAAIKLR